MVEKMGGSTYYSYEWPFAQWLGVCMALSACCVVLVRLHGYVILNGRKSVSLPHPMIVILLVLAGASASMKGDGYSEHAAASEILQCPLNRSYLIGRYVPRP